MEVAENPVVSPAATTVSEDGISIRTRPSAQMLADRPLEDETADHLGYRAYATALAELIDNRETATPLTIAISAPWGAGKTSLGKLLQSELIKRARDRRARPHAFVWFDAWKHDAAEHLGAAFAADVARKLGRQRARLWRLLVPLPAPFLSARSRWWRRVLAGAGLLAAITLLVAVVPEARNLLGNKASQRLRELEEDFGGTPIASLATFLLFIAFLSASVFRVAKGVVAYVSDPRAEAARGSMDDVSQQVGSLVRQATGRWRRRGRRVVIFVDDLERCQPPRALEVCEVAAQLLAHPNVVVVLLADMSVIASSAEIKYSKLEDSADDEPTRRGVYGRRYLQKLVQIEFTLPPARLEDLRSMLEAEADGAPPVRQDLQVPESSAREAWLNLVPTYGGAFIGVIAGVWREQSKESSFNGIEAEGGLPFLLTEALFPEGVLGGVIGASALPAARWFQRKLAARSEKRIDAEIETIKREGVADSEELVHRVLQSKPAKRRRGLALQRLRESFVDDAQLKAEATKEIVAYLPALPRSAKRMSNHLRILLVVAYERKMLGGSPALTAGHIGKWVVLNERWPELARFLTLQPTSVCDLETTPSVDDLGQRLIAAGIYEPASDELLRFLKEPPLLGDVLPRLVHLDPAERAA
jgi:hypothetical protein